MMKTIPLLIALFYYQIFPVQSVIAQQTNSKAANRIERLVQIYSEGKREQHVQADKELIALNKDDMIQFIEKSSSDKKTEKNIAPQDVLDEKSMWAIRILEKRDEFKFEEQIDLLLSKQSSYSIKRIMICWFHANKSKYSSVLYRTKIMESFLSILKDSSQDEAIRMVSGREAFVIAIAFSSHYSLLVDGKIPENPDDKKALVAGVETYSEKLGELISDKQFSESVLINNLAFISRRMHLFKISDKAWNSVSNAAKAAVENSSRSKDVSDILKQSFLTK